MINSKIQIDFLGTSIELSEPNVGELLQINSLKNVLSGNTYAATFEAARVSSVANMTLDLIDCFALISVLAPDAIAKANLQNVTSIEKLSVALSKKIVTEYRNKVKPWLKGIEDFWYSETEVNPSTAEAAKND